MSFPFQHTHPGKVETKSPPWGWFAPITLGSKNYVLIDFYAGFIYWVKVWVHTLQRADSVGWYYSLSCLGITMRSENLKKDQKASLWLYMCQKYSTEIILEIRSKGLIRAIATI